MKKKITVRRETHELKIIARPRISENFFCAGCGREVRWLAPEEAMMLAGVSLREVFRLVERRDLHFAETADGFLILCAASLAEKWTRK